MRMFEGVATNVKTAIVNYVTAFFNMKRDEELVVSSNIRNIVKVTESNYPTTPDPDTLYVVVEDTP